MRIRTIALILCFILATFALAQPPSPTPAPLNMSCQRTDTTWLLRGDNRFVPDVPYLIWGNQQAIVAVVITPEPVCNHIIEAAWSHAVRYSARGIDLPDYVAAVDLMMQRHPNWIASVTKGFQVSFDGNSANLDTPTAPTAPIVTPTP